MDSVIVKGGRLYLEGWGMGDRIGLRQGRATTWAVPHINKPGSSERGFAVDQPFEPGPFSVLVQQDGTVVETSFSGVTHWAYGLRRSLLLGPYLVDIIRALPLIWRWLYRGEMGARETLKERLYLVPIRAAVQMHSTVVLADDAPSVIARPAALILPVYNGFDVLPETLRRIAAHSGENWKLILIEDCSPDPQIRPFLRAWCAENADRVDLVENSENLGFIGSVNVGLSLAAQQAPGDPVVLVNADAWVPPGWLPRLLAPLEDVTVASVTPLSNDAELYCVPTLCQPHALADGMVDRLDVAAQTLRPAHDIDIPTGVGFCMALAPHFLAQVPNFDPAFGRGYGEEVDWCQKTRALGGRHVAAVNLFVEHRGGASFGQTQKTLLLARNGAEISRRYPSYDAQVQDFIRSDPLVTFRLALGLDWAALSQKGDAVPIYLAHAMGGGAEAWLQRRLKEHTQMGDAAVVLRVGLGRRWNIELHSELGMTQGLTDETELVRTLLHRLPRRRIIYSCGVGMREAHQLPGILCELASNGEHRLEVLFHDFFPISPSYTLLGEDGGYRGVPRGGSPSENDHAHSFDAPNERISLAHWQASWGELITAAHRITVFSQSSAAIVRQVWPEAAPRIQVRPHTLHSPLLPVASATDARTLTIAALGNIGAQKGAGVLEQLSRKLAQRNDLRLVIIGHIDPSYSLSKPGIVHGSYEPKDIPALIQRYQISGWIIPSIWPETFSFTTHEAIATGLPVLVFDLGAQADAVADIDQGYVLPLDAIEEGLEPDFLCDILRRGRQTP